MEKRYYAWIDLARFCFAILLVVYHFYGIMPNGIRIISDDTINSSLFGTCSWYLDFFFVSSGFCITSAWAHKVANVPFRQFFGKHYLKFVGFTALTIMPAFIARYIISLSGKDAAPSMLHAFGSVLMLDMFVPGYKPYNGPLWYLSSLMICYAIFYMLAKVSVGNRRKYCFLFSMIVIAAFILENSSLSISSLYSHHIEAIIGFGVGGVLHELYLTIENIKYKRIIKYFWMSFLLLFSSGAMVFYIWHRGSISSTNRDLIMVTLFSMPLVFLLALADTDEKQTRTFKKLGALSISIYIWHDIIVYFVQAFHCNQWIDKTKPSVLFWSVVIIAIVAIISCMYLEPGLNKLLYKIIKENNRKTADDQNTKG